MAEQRTPGPWEARYSTRGGYWFIDREQDGESYTLTTLDGGVCEADARLIAAAPDLLVALQDIVQASNANDGESLMNAIQAAIARVA